jgi:glycerol uptake facilitator protein
MTGFIGEFFGMLVLIVLGVGCGAGIHLNRTFAHGESWLFLTIAWGFAVAFGVYVAGKLGSAGHLNPAVTIGFAVFGFFPWREVPAYLAGQFLGAFAGAAIIVIQYLPHFRDSKNVAEGNEVGIFSTSPAISSALLNFASEMIATFFFVFILFNLGNFTTGLKPLIVGFLVTAIGQSLGSTTGFAINPARDFGPRFAYAILPVPNKTSANWSYSWVPICGPLAGGIVAGGLQYMLIH